jgi:hypothetical protein
VDISLNQGDNGPIFYSHAFKDGVSSNSAGSSRGSSSSSQQPGDYVSVFSNRVPFAVRAVSNKQQDVSSRISDSVSSGHGNHGPDSAHPSRAAAEAAARAGAATSSGAVAAAAPWQQPVHDANSRRRSNFLAAGKVALSHDGGARFSAAASGNAHERKLPVGAAGALVQLPQQWPPVQQLEPAAREYHVQSRRSGTTLTRRLAQVAPSQCGKLGTYVPNYYCENGSMFGLSISPSKDGAWVVVGAPRATRNVTEAGGAVLLASTNAKTCEYKSKPVWQPKDSWSYFGAQVALSEDASTLVVMDGIEAVTTFDDGCDDDDNDDGSGCGGGDDSGSGNRPVVHVYRQDKGGPWHYLQRLECQLRQAKASAMAVSVSANGEVILVSFSIGEGFPHKVGSAQVWGQRLTQHNANNSCEMAVVICMPYITHVMRCTPDAYGMCKNSELALLTSAASLCA